MSFIQFCTAPKRKWDTKKQHISYGIYNWFKNKGITDQKVMNRLIDEFIEGKKINGWKIFYIDRHFVQFASFVCKHSEFNNFITNSTNN